MEKEYIDLLSQTEMAKREGKTRPTIMNWKWYIKVRFQNGLTRAMYKNWSHKSPYWYKYISRYDVKKVAEKQFWKKITFI